MFRFLMIFVAFALALSGCSPDDDFIPSVLDDDDDDDVTHYGEVALEPTGHLTAWLRWETAEPADSVVEFGIGALEYRASYAEPVTEHEVLLAGMRPDETYQIRVTSSTEDGLVFEEDGVEFTNDPLPDWLPLETVFNEYAHDDAVTDPGWTALNIAVLQEDAAMLTTPVTVVVLDHEGQPIFFYRQDSAIPATADVIATWDDDGIVVGGGVAQDESPFKISLAGDILWEDDFVQPMAMAEDYLHHVYYKNTDEYLVSMFISYADGISDKIVAYDVDMAEVWSWDSHILTSECWSGPFLGNVAIVEPDEGVAYYGAHNESLLYKIDMDTGEVIWEMGQRHCSGTLGDFAGEYGHPRAWPMLSHGMEHDGDRWIFYDNRSDLTGSRVVEYELNEETMEASIVWEYPGEYSDDFWYADVWGDVDWLENGNVLVNTGQSWAIEPSSVQHELDDAWAEAGHSRLFELAPVNGEEGKMRIVWEVTLEGDITGSYAADRFPALLEFTQ